MFAWLGSLVIRRWPVLLAAWLLLFVLTRVSAPSWQSVARARDFTMLPPDAPSRRGDQVFRAAFPRHYAGSMLVIVLWREGTDQRLQDADFRFIAGPLVQGLRKGTPQPPAAGADRPKPLIKDVRTFEHRGAGLLLTSPDRTATIVLIDCSIQPSDPRNRDLIAGVEGVLARLRREGQAPAGLDMALTGVTVFWRDVRLSAETSARTIERWTVATVLVILLLLYRSPLLVAGLLATVFIALQVSLQLLQILAQHGLVVLFQDLRILITVLVYGAGVDFCLFLSARYREELDVGAEPDVALRTALGKVGGTIAASATAAIVGMGVLSLSRLVKIHETGVAIPLSFLVVLAACLTLYPALLRLLGRWIFWPQRGLKAWGVPAATGRLRPLLHWHLLPNVWDRLGRVLLRWPATIALASLAVLAPFVVHAASMHERLSFDPLNDLPASAPSVVGLRALQRHFTPGLAGPVLVLISDPNVRFSPDADQKVLEELTQRLEDHKAELGIADVRSLVRPLGSYPAVKKMLAEKGRVFLPFIQTFGRPTYVSSTGEHAEHVVRFDLELEDDPLSEAATARLDRIESFLGADLPEKLRGARVDFFGPTVMLRDVRDLLRRDQQRTHLLVPACIFVVLLVVFYKPDAPAREHKPDAQARDTNPPRWRVGLVCGLRAGSLALYLVLTVLLSYFATLGVTRMVFYLLQGPAFPGLDWKVPLILFTVLLALGADYNIFLVKAVEEEEKRDPGPQAVTRGLARTGRVISGCGFILAATLATLMTGSLGSLRQLGFALGFGILLDTFFVRPVLVPLYLILVRRRQPQTQ